ncbi:unnamed protein product, partial [marine sediment metagenome]
PTIPGANIAALSARGLGDDEPANDIILFSISDQQPVILGGTPFHRGDIIAYYPDTGVYALKVDTEAILDHPNLVLDCLAVLSDPDDPRLLLSFDVDPVTGTDKGPIKSQDIAIWNPEDDSITLHISMSEDTWVIGSGTALLIVSWEIDPYLLGD